MFVIRSSVVTSIIIYDLVSCKKKFINFVSIVALNFNCHKNCQAYHFATVM